jgi:hypothetical protein
MMIVRSGSFALLVACFCGLLAKAADDPRQKVLADWAANKKRFASVRYKLSGTLDMKATMPGASAAQRKDVIGPAVQPVRAVVLLDITNKRFRIESSRPRPSLDDRTKWVFDDKVMAYNGKVLHEYIPRDRNERTEKDPDLSLVKGSLHLSQVWTSSYWPVLTAHGFVPTVHHPPHADRLPEGHDPDDFEVAGSGVISGRKCTILRTDPMGSLRDEYWVDLDRGGAIVRQVYFNDKMNPWYRFDTEYQEVGGGWLPRRWTLAKSMNHQVWEVEKVEVESVEVNPAITDEDFTIPITPGMVVQEVTYPSRGSGLDPSRPATRSTRVKKDGQSEMIEERGFTTTEGIELPPEGKRFRWWWFALGVGVLGLGYVGYRFRRPSRPAAAQAG